MAKLDNRELADKAAEAAIRKGTADLTPEQQENVVSYLKKNRQLEDVPTFMDEPKIDVPARKAFAKSLLENLRETGKLREAMEKGGRD